jgi:hypothetical protein
MDVGLKVDIMLVSRGVLDYVSTNRRPSDSSLLLKLRFPSRGKAGDKMDKDVSLLREFHATWSLSLPDCDCGVNKGANKAATGYIIYS